MKGDLCDPFLASPLNLDFICDIKGEANCLDWLKKRSAYGGGGSQSLSKDWVLISNVHCPVLMGPKGSNSSWVNSRAPRRPMTLLFLFIGFPFQPGSYLVPAISIVCSLIPRVNAACGFSRLNPMNPTF
jgi:hypothetical protein